MNLRAIPMSQGFATNFLGQSPGWYKLAIIGFLIINPVILSAFGPFVAGWFLVAEFIFTLAMALKCYPLQPGGLLVLEAMLLGISTPDLMFKEALNNFEVIILLVFMVAGVFFLKDLLFYLFGKLFSKIQSKTVLSLLFCFTAGVLSAFLDALTVTAVLITVAGGFYQVFHRVVSDELGQEVGKDLEQFRAFLRSLMMHGAVGTALGGVCTLVGEPQNLLIAKVVGWTFSDFFWAMAPVTVPVFAMGLVMCALLEKLKIFGYGQALPLSVRKILDDDLEDQESRRSSKDKSKLVVQGIVALLICLSLAFHVAEVGMIGLFAIVILTSLNGITDEHKIGKAFEESLPFVALLMVFFGVVSVIHSQHLFAPITQWVLSLDPSSQPSFLYVANGILSMVSDNVFVATVYINEVKSAFDLGVFNEEHFHKLAVAINVGTNIPSIATPNGQAAFLFLLTSGLAPLIRLDYTRMVVMSLPYTIVLGIMGFVILTAVL